MSDKAGPVFPVGPTAFMPGTLIPALKGCPNCRTVQMIASPALGECPECGAAMQVVTPGSS